MLCVNGFWRYVLIHVVDKRLLRIFRRVVPRTRARVVLISDWRHIPLVYLVPAIGAYAKPILFAICPSNPVSSLDTAQADAFRESERAALPTDKEI